MTKNELKKGVYEIFTGGPFMDAFDEEIDRLIHSGAIDFEEDIGAARIVLIAAMEKTLTHFGPIVRRSEEMLINLRRI